MGGAAATRLAVPQSRQLRHNDTWHGESLDRLAIPRARTDVTRPSHHLSPREAPRLQLPGAAAGPGGQLAEPASSGSSHHPSPRLQLPRAVTNPGGQRAEPASCAPHHPSPRSSGGRAATRGTLKSGSDPDLAARESSFANSTTLTRVMPSAVAADSDTRAMLHAQPQRPSDRARGSTTTLSRQIPRPAALVIDCDAGDDDDVAELPLSARNHHASPASHTRQRRDRRSPGGPGANHSDSPRGTTVGKAQGGRAHGGRRSAVAQTSPPSSASPLDPASPSPTSPRFPCAPFPRAPFPRALQPMAQHPIAEHAMVDGLTVLHRRSRTLDRRPAPSESLPDCHLPQRAACDERASRHARVGSHGGVCVHVQRVGGMAGAGENAQWVGGDEDWRMVQETPWKEEGEGEDVEATRGWQWEAEGDGLERGRVERHDPIQAQVPNPALVRGSENKGSSKSREKPKSKLQRSLSDDEEEEQAKVVRPSRDGSSRLKQQGKRGAVLKV
ncbi:unnamed protein product [Closterium sp. NIES-65]|nr:unnamed protein product [Closterium sp. NIES-65]